MQLNDPQTILLLGLSLFLLVAAINDVREQRIPNILTLPALALVLAWQSYFGGLSGFLFALGGLGVGLGSLFIPFALRKLGAGDVKLMGVVGAALGPEGALTAFIFVSLAGGVYAMLVLGWQKIVDLVALRGHGLAEALAVISDPLGAFVSSSIANRHKKIKLCYGLAIGAGAVAAMLWHATGRDWIIRF